MEPQYQHKVQLYEQGRLGYAEESFKLIEGLVPVAHSKITDAGSGTGIFSEALLKRGYTVYGVEPDRDLGQKAEKNLAHYKNFTALAAAAEDTGLPSHSMDAIIAASAFHWFDTQRFLRECERILKPNGYIFLIYNVRQSRDLFSLAHQDICLQHCPKFSSFQHGADMAKNCCPMIFSDSYREMRYPYNLGYGKEQFLSRCLSSSYSLNQTQPGYLAYQQDLKQLIDQYAENGVITIRNDTVVWYGKLYAHIYTD